MNRCPNRAEVCLEAGKTASRHKTKRGNRGKNRPKSPKIRTERKTRPESRVFPQPVRPNVDLIGFIGMRPRGFPGTPVVRFQNCDLIRGSLSASIEASEGLETLRTADLEIGATNLRISSKGQWILRHLRHPSTSLRAGY